MLQHFHFGLIVLVGKFREFLFKLHLVDRSHHGLRELIDDSGDFWNAPLKNLEIFMEFVVDGLFFVLSDFEICPIDFDNRPFIAIRPTVVWGRENCDDGWEFLAIAPEVGLIAFREDLVGSDDASELVGLQELLGQGLSEVNGAHAGFIEFGFDIHLACGAEDGVRPNEIAEGPFERDLLEPVEQVDVFALS